MRLPIAAAILVCVAGAAPAQQVPRPVPRQGPPPLISCPPHLDVESGDRIVVPQGWDLRPERQRHWLRGAELYEGDPADRVQLRPDQDRRTRREWWDLGGNAQPYRLVCVYEGLQSGVMATVPERARRCEVRDVPENSRGMRHGRVVTEPRRVEVDCR